MIRYLCYFVSNCFKILIVLAILVVLFALPWFKDSCVYNYIIGNHIYFEIVFSILTIFLTIWSVNKQISVSMAQWRKQQQKQYEEAEKRNQESENHRREEEKQYSIKQFISNERELQKVRPTFMVNRIKNEEGYETYKLDIYVQDCLVDEVRVFIKQFSKRDKEITCIKIGTLQSKNISLDELNRQIEDIELILITCKTIYQEQIYYLYYYDEVSFHFREVLTSEEITKNKEYLQRKYLTDFIHIKETLAERIEIYKETINQPSVKELSLKRFVRLLNIINKQEHEKYIDKISSDENLELLNIIEEYEIGLLLGKTLNYIAKEKKVNPEPFYKEILKLIKELLISSEIIVGHFPFEIEYFQRNVGGWSRRSQDVKWFYNKYIHFSNAMDKEFLLGYIDDFYKVVNTVDLTISDLRSQVGYSSRNIEVFLSECTRFKKEVHSDTREKFLEKYSCKVADILYRVKQKR